IDEADMVVVRKPAREPEVDGDPPLLLLGEAVGVDAGQRAHEGRLAVIDVAGRADEALSSHGASLSRVIGTRPSCPNASFNSPAFTMAWPRKWLFVIAYASFSFAMRPMRSTHGASSSFE